MKIYFDEAIPESILLDGYLKGDTFADYIYMYPPRQSYQIISNVNNKIIDSLEDSDVLNLYFHFPFCKQICAFCNLFATARKSEDIFDEYIKSLIKEIDGIIPLIKGKKIDTIYLGGGTPSILETRHFESIFNFLEQKLGCTINSIPEISLEVSPDSISLEKFLQLKNIGINRINIGMQAFNDKELASIGRKYGLKASADSLDIIKEVEFDNVCVDLIYGLEGQCISHWKDSLEKAISFQPETICTYPLTLRPSTGFDKRGYTHISGKEQYQKYDISLNLLEENGYSQETHVRYIKEKNGGYRQKTNHWKGQNILGFGAGARSYLKYCDLRNGYSTKRRNQTIKEYMRNIETIGNSWTEGILMDKNERMRKSIILGLNDFNIIKFNEEFSINPLIEFESIFDLLFARNFIEHDGSKIRLTPYGVRYRDLIVQLFFSRNVREKVKSYRYED